MEKCNEILYKYVNTESVERLFEICQSSKNEVILSNFSGLCPVTGLKTFEFFPEKSFEN